MTERKAARRPKRSRATMQPALDGMARLSEHLAATPDFKISQGALARLPKRERRAVEAARATSLYIADLIAEALRAWEHSRLVLEAKLRRKYG